MSQKPWEDHRISLMLQIFSGRVASVIPVSYAPAIAKPKPLISADGPNVGYLLEWAQNELEAQDDAKQIQGQLDSSDNSMGL